MRFSVVTTLLVLGFLSSCSKNPGGTSNVSFRVPSVAELNSKALPQEKAGDVGSLAIPSGELTFANACFMVNITAPDLAPTSGSAPQCAIPSGLFKGSVAPGGEVTLSVPKGPNRKIEILVYFRSSPAAPCLSNARGLTDFDLSRTARVGVVTANLVRDSESVDIGIQLPAQGVTVVSQYSLPAVCGPSVTPASATGLRAVSGSVVRSISVVNGYTLDGRISAPLATQSTSNNGYKLIRRGH